VLLRLDERAVGRDDVAALSTEEGRGVVLVERADEDQGSGGLHLVLEGEDTPHERLHLLR
jgi:hypothetical protein